MTLLTLLTLDRSIFYLTVAHGCPGVFQIVQEFQGVSRGFKGFPVFQGVQGFQGVPRGFKGFQGVSRDLRGLNGC